MNLVVEAVSVDSFYVNLLLGVPKLLDDYRRMRVRKRHLVRYQPASESDISAWESNNEVLLPDDLKDFYSSTNGFSFKWICSYGLRKLTVMGKIEVNSLEHLIPVVGLKTKLFTDIHMDEHRFRLNLGNDSRVFELCTLDNCGARVILVFRHSKHAPTVWLHTTNLKFYYLTDNFTAYFRMAVAHIGFPNWQLVYTSDGIPEWMRILMRLIAPKLLTGNKTKKGIELLRMERMQKKIQRSAKAKINVLDPNVFNCQNRPGTTGSKKSVPSRNCAVSPRKKRYHWIQSRYLRKLHNSSNFRAEYSK